MNIEFKDHQKVVSGLLAQIQILEWRIVEKAREAATKDCQLDALRELRAEDEKRIHDYEERCNRLVEDNAQLTIQAGAWQRSSESWEDTAASLRKQLARLKRRRK